MKKYFLILLFLFIPYICFAQNEKVTFTITPPLIKNNVNPGQIWKSSVKLVNNNPNEISTKIQVVDFKGGQNDGTIEFVNFEGTDDNPYLLSNWITLLQDEVIIPPFQSKEISFIVDVPEDADPGGHYAAILAGSKPPEEGPGGSSLKISTLLSSLLLLNVKGDVNENGIVREFSVKKNIFSKPDVDFLVRFQNMGNVHIQPQGEIKIFNFLDKEVGSIPLNQKTEFGNVLPGDIRKWEFNWKGDDNIFSMGRYKALLLLQYGNENKETVDQTLFFWVVYTKPIILTLSILIIFIILIIFFIKRYIKKTVESVQVDLPAEKRQKKVKKIIKKKTPSMKPRNQSNVSGVVDLKEVNNNKKKTITKKNNSFDWSFVKKILVMLIVIFIIVIGFFAFLFFRSNSKEIQPSSIVENENNKEEILKEEQKVKEGKIKETNISTSSEDVKEDDLIDNTDEYEAKKKDLIISVQNGNGTKGLASDFAKLIKDYDFGVLQKKNADNFNYTKTEISYKENLLDYVDEIDKIAGVNSDKKILPDNSDYDLIIIIGADYK